MKRRAGSLDARVILVNAASKEQAISIANALVKERLAACANIVSPIRSVYRWQGEVQDETEHLMIIKTRARLVAKVEARVKAMHSYEVPEVIALPIVAGSESYLDWIFASTEAEPRVMAKTQAGSARSKSKN